MSVIVLALKVCVLFFSIFAGNAKIPVKIIGGSIAKIEEVPHAVSIRSSGDHNCGGSFIDLNHVITAAHCLVLPDNLIDNDIEILSGTNNRQDTLDGTIHHVIAIIVHPDYQHGSFVNDIAICRLAKSINVTTSQRPIALTEREPPLNVFARITGWGFLIDGSGVNSRYLRKLDMLMISQNECQRWLTNTIDIRQICTQRKDKRTITNGDSGGGLVYKNELIGIAVASISDGEYAGYPVVYSSVYAYRTWIAQVIERY